MEYVLKIWIGESTLLDSTIVNNSIVNNSIQLNKFEKYYIYIEKLFFSRILEKIHFNGKHPIRINSDEKYINLTNEEYLGYYYPEFLAGVIRSETSHQNYAEEICVVHFSNGGTFTFERPELFIDLQDYRSKQIGLLFPE
jgi:hypothetical protein